MVLDKASGFVVSSHASSDDAIARSVVSRLGGSRGGQPPHIVSA
jgi:hypothetical protein